MASLIEWLVAVEQKKAQKQPWSVPAYSGSSAKPPAKKALQQANNGPILPWQIPYVLKPMARELVRRGAPLTALNDARADLQQNIVAQQPAGKLHLQTDRRFTNNVSLKVIHW
jgi:hypothetical protein